MSDSNWITDAIEKGKSKKNKSDELRKQIEVQKQLDKKRKIEESKTLFWMVCGKSYSEIENLLSNRSGLNITTYRGEIVSHVHTPIVTSYYDEVHVDNEGGSVYQHACTYGVTWTINFHDKQMEFSLVVKRYTNTKMVLFVIPFEEVKYTPSTNVEKVKKMIEDWLIEIYSEQK